MSLFGAWDFTKVKDTDYQAATDGIVMYVDINGAGGSQLEGFTDAATPPKVRVAGNHIEAGLAGRKISITFAVRKNEYWKVTGGTGTEQVIFLPLGT